jgi:hypothetical protein
VQVEVVARQVPSLLRVVTEVAVVLLSQQLASCLAKLCGLRLVLVVSAQPVLPVTPRVVEAVDSQACFEVPSHKAML